jgi:Zn-dependent M28 family amino/carboxypeptidase
LLNDAAAQQGRTIVGEPEPQKGYLYRSDHLPFMHAGVPALAIFFSAMDFMQQRANFIAFDYHKTTDKPKPDWDLSGAAADAALLFEVGRRILQTGYRATWNATSEFNPGLSKRV